MAPGAAAALGRQLLRRLAGAGPGRGRAKHQGAAVPLTAALERRARAAAERYRGLERRFAGEGAARLGGAELRDLQRELGQLERAHARFRELEGLRRELGDLRAIEQDAAEDAGLRELAREEAQGLRARLAACEHAVAVAALPRNVSDDGGAVMEIRAGAGGDEAGLFAMDLLRMYERSAQQRGWRFEVAALAKTAVGGCRDATVAVSGAGAYGALKFESGVHRVQRVPLTEASGRVHTSAASVAVLPQVEEVDAALSDADLRIDTFRASGAGGQHVNTTESAVRITHAPTGLVVAIQDERSQHKNKAKALKILRAKVFDHERRKRDAARSEARKGLIGSGDRSERIRTYNFPQGRVTDHRIGLTTHSLELVLGGEGLETFSEALQVEHLVALGEALAEEG